MLAGIPESEDLACLGGRLVTPPDLQCQVLRLEPLEGTPTWVSLVGGDIIRDTDSAEEVCEGGGHFLCFGVLPNQSIRSGATSVRYGHFF